MTIGRDVELGIRRIRDGVFDALVSMSHFQKASHRSVARQGNLVLCRFDDHQLAVDPADFVGRAVIDHGNFDRHRTNLVCKRASELSAGKGVLEVGANIGTQTVYFLKSGLFESVVSLEPDPHNVQILQTNLLLNGLTGNVDLVPAAAGERADTLTLRRMKGNSGGASLRTDQPIEKIVSEIQVDVMTLDALHDSGRINTDELGLIWIDTEGHEEEIFKGGKGLLSKGIPLAFEFSPILYADGKARRIAEIIFGSYKHVSKVDDSGFKTITLDEMVKLTNQADIFCHN